MSMDREKILKHLARVMDQVAEREKNVSQHRKAVTELGRDGHDARLALKMLNYAEHVHSINIGEQQRLEKILGKKIDERQKIEGWLDVAILLAEVANPTQCRAVFAPALSGHPKWFGTFEVGGLARHSHILQAPIIQALQFVE